MSTFTLNTGLSQYCINTFTSVKDLCIRVVLTVIYFNKYCGCRTDLHLIFDLPADLLQRLLLGFGERQFGGNWVTFGHQRPTLLLGQHQRARPLQFLLAQKQRNSAIRTHKVFVGDGF